MLAGIYLPACPMNKKIENATKTGDWAVAVHTSDNKWVTNTDAAITDAMLRMELANARKSRHLTQKQLSELSGLSESCISNIENTESKTSPTLRSLARYCAALDIDINIGFKPKGT